MPTLRLAFTQPWDGTGYEGAFLEEDLTIAQEETLQKVLERVDPTLTPTPGSGVALMAGPAVTIVSRAFTANDRLRGVVATSDRAVRWSLLVNGVEKLAFRTETAKASEPIMLPGSILAGAVTVAVQALNESDQGNAACDAVLLWYSPVV